MSEPIVIQCYGQIQGCNFEDLDNLYCKYSFLIGPDWTTIGGVEYGLTQIACKKSHDVNDIIWNFPVDITFKTTNLYGWPRIIVSVYGIDFLGRDVIRGYGSALTPLVPGYHEMKIETHVPLASSIIDGTIAWLLGDLPEYYDAKVAGRSEGREVTRTCRSGSVNVSLNMKIKGLEACGYTV